MYDVNYFKEKFSKIPENKWTTGSYTDGGKSCALGHCGVENCLSSTEEGNALVSLFRNLNPDSNNPMFIVTSINDGYSEGSNDYPDKHSGLQAKERILVALDKIEEILKEKELEENCVIVAQEIVNTPIKELVV